MNDVVADTHTILWYLYDVAKLSPAAEAALTVAEQSGTIYISAITLVEVAYLETKPSFPYAGALQDLFRLVSDPSEHVRVLPVTIDVARAVIQVPRGEVPEMPDRIVAATAVAHRLPVVSVDSDIRGSASLNALVSVIW